jgi:hypothetical protein
MECYLPFPRRTGGGSTGECWRADTGRFTGASGYLRAVLALAKRPSLLRHTGSGCPPHPRHRANEAKGGTLRQRGSPEAPDEPGHTWPAMNLIRYICRLGIRSGSKVVCSDRATLADFLHDARLAENVESGIALSFCFRLCALDCGTTPRNRLWGDATSSNHAVPIQVKFGPPFDLGRPDHHLPWRPYVLTVP